MVRNIALEPRIKWQAIVEHYLNKKVDLQAYQFFAKDYEHARKYLKLLIKPEDFTSIPGVFPFASVNYFPGTVSVLVLHYERQFRFLTVNDIAEWKQTQDELVQQALINIGREKMMVENRLFNGVDLRIISSPEYSAAAMMDIENIFPDLVGERGVVFGLPSNAVVIAMPLNSKRDLFHAFEPMMRFTIAAYRHEPGPIGFDLYHYHKGKISSMMEVMKQEYPATYKRIFG